MQLYKTYMNLWKEGTVNAGFSPRLPDYAIKYWLEQLERVLPEGHQRSFLDVGAGDGRLSLLLLHSYTTSGSAIEVQINKSAWEPIVSRYGRFQLHEGLLQEKMAALQGKKTFDFILLAEVFEHIPPADVPGFLEQLRGLLSDTGSIFLTTPNCLVQGPAEKSAVWHEKEPYGHYKHYTFRELEKLLALHRFQVTWYGFECHRAKSVLYNKWFYPASRLDAKLLQTKKLPSFVRSGYRVLSVPFLPFVKLCFWGLAQVVYAVERRYSNENTAATMMLLIKKQT